MIKYKLYLLIFTFLFLCCEQNKTHTILIQDENREEQNWKLVWEDDFEVNKLDTTKWSFCAPSQADWAKHMSNKDMCYEIKDSKIFLKGIINPDTSQDKRTFLTAGIFSRSKLEFLYGKIEVRAKIESAKGAWPAIWLINNYEVENKKWPPRDYSEIDILEHLNFDDVIYQTIHSYYTLELKQKENPKYSDTTRVNVGKFNTYTLKWYRDKLIFMVNNKETFAYPKIEGAVESQWPFDKPLYIILSQQLGGSWVGDIDPGDLPVQMIIDWVKIYQ